MNPTFLFCVTLLGAAGITPSTSSQAVEISTPDKKGYLTSPEKPFVFEATGPASFIVKLRGQPLPRKANSVQVTVRRNERFEANHQLTFAKRRSSPKGYPHGAEIGLSIPDGTHSFSIQPARHDLLVILTPTQKLPARLAALVPEKDLGPPPNVQAPTEPAQIAPPPMTKPQASPAQPAGPATRVLIMNVTAAGIDDSVAAQVTEAIAEAMQGRTGIEAVTADELTTIAETETLKQSTGCEADSACLAEISTWVNADRVINGTLGMVGESINLTLSLVDSKQASVVNRVSRVIQQPQEAIAATQALVQELFGWEGAGNKITYRIQEGKAVSFAVFDLTTAGLSENAARNLTQVLSVELKRIQGASVIGKEDIAAMLDLEGQKQVLGCDSNTSCLAEIGGALGVDKLVVGQVGKLAENFIISLRLISPTTAKVDNRVSENFMGTEATLIPAIRTAGRKLLGIESREPGSLGVSSSERDATVFLDGKEHGVLPMPPIQELDPGRYSLRVQKEGYFDWNGDVYVNPLDNTAMWVELMPRPAKWYQQWWVWTGVGVVAAGVATTLALTLQPEASTGSGTVTINSAQ